MTLNKNNQISYMAPAPIPPWHNSGTLMAEKAGLIPLTEGLLYLSFELLVLANIKQYGLDHHNWEELI